MNAKIPNIWAIMAISACLSGAPSRAADARPSQPSDSAKSGPVGTAMTATALALIDETNALIHGVSRIAYAEPHKDGPAAITNAVLTATDDQQDSVSYPRLADVPIESQTSLWSMLYDQGTLETLIECGGTTGRDVYTGDLRRWTLFGRDCSLGFNVEAGFVVGNSGRWPMGEYVLRLFVQTKLGKKPR